MIKNTSCTVTYVAWDSTDSSLCSGDAANHTCQISQNGGAFVTAVNSPSSLGSGVYALTLTASETNTAFLTLSVSSSTSGVIIPPVQIVLHDPNQFKADVSSLASDVWNVSTRTLTAPAEVSAASVTSIQSGLATSSEVSALSGKIDTVDSVCDAMSAVCTSTSTVCNSMSTVCNSISTTCTGIDDSCDSILVRTNLIPDRPAAVGSAMTLTDAYSSLAALNASSIASAVLGYDISNVESTAPLFSLCTIILAHLQSSVDGSTWTIYRTNGTTQHAARTVSSSDDSVPITGVSDPA